MTANDPIVTNLWEQGHIYQWLSELALSGDVAAATLSARETDVRLFAEWCTEEGIANVQELTTAHCRRYIRDLEKRGRTPYTIARIASSFKRFMRWMIDRGVVTSNPMDGVQLPVANKVKRTRYVNVDRAMIEHAPGSGPDKVRNQAILSVLADTGKPAVRIHEMSIHDVELRRTPKVRLDDEWFPITEATRALIREYLVLREEALRVPGEDRLWISFFRGHAGYPITYGQVYRAIRDATEKS